MTASEKNVRHSPEGVNRLAGYAAIPAHLLGGLTPHEIAVYVVLAAHVSGTTGEAWPSHKTIAALSGMAVSTVKGALTGLRDKGLVTWTAQRDEDGQGANLYRLANPSHTPATPSRETAAPQPPRGYEPKPLNLEEPPVAPAEPLALVETPPPAGDGGFAAFWAAYPNHASGKKRAEVAWRKATDRTGGVRPQVVMDALALFKRSEQWQRDGGRYIPHATTWLNQERYLEPPRPAARKPFADAL